MQEQTVHQPPPLGLNTVELLKVASRRLGLSPHRTMEVAESLYTSGYLSYPRTESTRYPATFDAEVPNVDASLCGVVWSFLGVLGRAFG